MGDTCKCGHRRVGHSEGGPCWPTCSCTKFTPAPSPARDDAEKPKLTDEEREALDVASTQYVHGGHIVPDLHTVVERIVGARVRAAQAQAWDEGVEAEYVRDEPGMPENPYRD